MSTPDDHEFDEVLNDLLKRLETLVSEPKSGVALPQMLHSVPQIDPLPHFDATPPKS